MPFEPSFGHVDVPAQVEAPKQDSPFRIAILGDFSGRAGRQESPDPQAFAGRKPVKVSREKLDDALAAFKITLRLKIDGKPAEVAVASLDDFHPDHLHEKVDRFAFLSDDDDKAAAMAALLHDPNFQSLESSWRGVDWLLRRAQKGGAAVEAVLYDLTSAEFRDALNASDDLTKTPIYQALIEQATQGPKGAPWSLFLGLYTFHLTGSDAQTLGRMAKISAQAAAPFLAAADRAAFAPGVVADAESASAWSALRQLPEAALLGLAGPRFLLRLPYGENTQSIERFSFEEFQHFKGYAGYLWGNPALACAALITQAFAKEGWGFRPGSILDLDSMPMHAYTKDDEEEVTLAESWLLRPAAEKIAKTGLMPLLCVKGKNALQLYRFLSLAQPPKDQPIVDLLGRWGQQGMVAVPRSTARPPMTVSAQFGPSTSAPSVSPPSARPVNAPAAAPVAAPASAAPEPEEPGVDPELAALMQQLETPPAAPVAKAEEPALDPELEALMKQLETPAAAPEAKPEEPALDPELEALMKQLEGN